MVLSELMPAIDGLTPVQLASADVLAGVALSNAAGWNQTADDWQLFTTQGRAIGWRTARSELVASAATLPYAGGMAWISMVLVATAWQHRGLAKRLLQDCVQQLQADGLLPLLDATPAGEAVYCRMGFRRGFEFQRWATQPGAQASSADRGPVAGVDLEEARGEKALAEMIALDREVSGLDRAFLLTSFMARSGSRAWICRDAAHQPVGFAIAREGRRATQIGPVVAASAPQAQALVQAARGALQGLVLIDVSTARQGLNDWLAQQGFAVQRGFVRMALSATLPACVTHPHDALFAVAGPEFG